MGKFLRMKHILGSERLFVSKKNHIVFGESTSSGVLTENCLHSLLKMGLPLPDFYNGELSKEHFIGSMDAES
jgi:hypothetical protein